MFEDGLQRLILEGVAGYRRDADLLKSMLAAVEESQAILEGLLPTSGRNDATSDLSRQGSLPDLVGRMRSPVGNPVTIPTDFDYAGTFAVALADTGVTQETPILDMARVCAAAGNGLIPTRVMAQTLISVGLSEASMNHLPGYISKKLLQSGEFERVGKRGSGVYRWLPFREASSDLAPADDVTDSEEANLGDALRVSVD